MQVITKSVSPTLAFRPYEARQYERAQPLTSPNLYAVMLIELPKLPGNLSDKCSSLGVICAQWAEWSNEDGDYSWGWIHLDYSSKRAIGDDLREMAMAPGEWIYMIIDWGEFIKTG